LFGHLADLSDEQPDGFLDVLGDVRIAGRINDLDVARSAGPDAAVDAGDPSADSLVPLLKIGVSRDGSEQVRDARLLFAGNAVLRDFSILPRLAEDAITQEIWEGTHPIIAGHALKALRRERSREAFLSMLPDASANLLSERLGMYDESEAVSVCEHAYDSLKDALMLSRESVPV